MSARKWNDYNKRRFLEDCQKYNERSVAHKWEITPSTVSAYRVQFTRDLGPRTQITDGRVTETRIPLQGFNPHTVAYYRRKAGLSLDKLAEMTKQTPELLAAYEDPTRRQVPYADKGKSNTSPAWRIAQALGVAIDDLCRAAPTPEPTTITVEQFADFVGSMLAYLARVEERLTAVNDAVTAVKKQNDDWIQEWGVLA